MEIRRRVTQRLQTDDKKDKKKHKKKITQNPIPKESEKKNVLLEI